LHGWQPLERPASLVAVRAFEAVAHDAAASLENVADLAIGLPLASRHDGADNTPEEAGFPHDFRRVRRGMQL